MLYLKKSNERGYNKIDWLESHFSFSFANYYEPKNMHFSHLRVINEDIVQPHTGFGFHGHKDMEIITFMLNGKIEHKDNLSNIGQLKEGRVQLMRAGTGIMHSEMNNFDEAAHLLQIWITPNQKNLTPTWYEKDFNTESNLEIIAEPINPDFDIKNLNSDIHGEGLKMAQNGYILKISNEQTLNFLENESNIYIHSVGEIKINNKIISHGDALYGSIDTQLTINAKAGFALIFIFPL